LWLDGADEFQTEAPCEIRPAVVIGDERNAAQGCKPILPFLELGLETREECEPVGLVHCRTLRIDANQRSENVGGDDLGIWGVEQIMRIAAAVAVRVADAHPAQVERGYPERCIDIAISAAPYVSARLGQQPVEPEIEIQSNSHHRPRLSYARQVLRMRLILF